MNPTAWRGIKLAAVLFIAGSLQAAFADSVKIWGAPPDLLLTAGLVAAMFCGEGSAALVGFAAGMIHASIAAPPHTGVGSIVVSRTLVCFGVGCLEDRLYRDSAIMALLVVVVGTAIAEGLFFIFSPQRDVFFWARHAAISLAWNALLSAPCYYAVRALLGPHRNSDGTLLSR